MTDKKINKIQDQVNKLQSEINKLKKNPEDQLTEIVVVLDRSGSMASLADDTVGGMNTFFKEQREAAGKANLTLFQFDHEYLETHQGVPIQDVPDLILGETYNPRGSTALLDAVGRAITTVRERITKSDTKPDHVIFVIQTDGYENSSSEYNRDQIKDLISQQEKESDWNFMFMGANEDAFQQAGGMGIRTANTVVQRKGAYSSVMSASVGQARRGVSFDSTVASYNAGNEDINIDNADSLSDVDVSTDSISNQS